MSSMPATPTKTISRRRPGRPRRVKVDVRQAVRSWLLASDAVERFSADVQEHRKAIMDELEASGEVDSKGNQWMHFPDDPIEGRIKGIKRERRVSRRLDEEKAREFLEAKGLLKECEETIVVLSEERLLALNFGAKAKITDAELEDLYVVQETYAFCPQRIKL